MISCRDMYKISAQAAKARGVHDEPLEALTYICWRLCSVAPARSGGPLYAVMLAPNAIWPSIEQQESAIGKLCGIRSHCVYCVKT